MPPDSRSSVARTAVKCVGIRSAYSFYTPMIAPMASPILSAAASISRSSRLLRLQAQLARVNLLIVDELGYVPLSQTGSELLFDVFSRRYENGATIVTSNLPFQEWTTVFASERLTGALLDRITHHVHILEMNGTQNCCLMPA